MAKVKPSVVSKDDELKTTKASIRIGQAAPPAEDSVTGK